MWQSLNGQHITGLLGNSWFLFFCFPRLQLFLSGPVIHDTNTSSCLKHHQFQSSKCKQTTTHNTFQQYQIQPFLKICFHVCCSDAPMGGGGASHVKRSWMLIRKLNNLFEPLEQTNLGATWSFNSPLKGDLKCIRIDN